MATTRVTGLATLPDDEAAGVVRSHPQLQQTKGTRGVILAVAAEDADEAAGLADLISAAREAMAANRTTARVVLEALLPPGRLAVSAPYLEQVRRNADDQAELADQFRLLSSAEVARLAGSRSVNPAALASRWRQEKKVFAVDVRHELRYPAFQLDAKGRPRPAVSNVIAALGERLSGWGLAVWFTSSNDWLGGTRPVDLLDSNPSEIGAAAEKLADEFLG